MTSAESKEPQTLNEAIDRMIALARGPTTTNSVPNNSNITVMEAPASQISQVYKQNSTYVCCVRFFCAPYTVVMGLDPDLFDKWTQTVKYSQ